MRMLTQLVAVALAASLQPAMADPTVLDFNDVGTTTVLNGSYQGFDISGNAWSAYSVNCGSPGISFDSATQGCGALLVATDPTATDTAKAATLTIALTGGFVDAVTFAYSGRVGSIGLTARVFDEAGKELVSSLNLGPSGQDCSTTYEYCTWATGASLSFKGAATSVTFSAVDNVVLLDNIGFTRQTTTNNPLPEPGSVALAFCALGALGWTRRRAAR